MKTCIGVMGASIVSSEKAAIQAYEAGKAIARNGAVLITGATTGLPFHAARGATEAKGEVIGFSPAINAIEHQRLGLPFQYHDLIVYTGMGSHGRNLLNVRASDALLFVGGSMGAFNEFTIAYDEDKIIGILEGSGGFCNHLREWILEIGKPNSGSILHYGTDPELLVDDLLTALRARSFEVDEELP